MSNSRRNINSRQDYEGTQRPKKRLSKKAKRSRKIGIILGDIQLIVTLVFSGLLFLLNVLPMKYLIILIFVLLFFVGYAFLSQFTKRYRMLGKVVSVFLSVVFIFGSYYLIETKSMLSKISGVETKKDAMEIVVLKDDPAQSINDTVDYIYGINEIVDRANTNETIQSINEELDTDIRTSEYAGFDILAEALYSGDVKVIIINEAFREFIHETHPDFDEKTRVLAGYEVETIVDLTGADKKITEEPFTVYISGIDTTGTISKTGRSDVNIIATVNPNTNQVLLTSTPRDYYVHLPNSGDQRDKLTHAGKYGVDISVETLENLYDIEIDYYARVNFTTLIELVDALGGVTVQSEYSFNAGGFSFNKGENRLNGEQALAFSRERKSFGSGDHQRGRNQMAVIKGIINKAISPAIITNYSSIMDSISGSFETNMSSAAITGLIKYQIDGMYTWDIMSNNVIGTSAMRETFSQSGNKKYSVVLTDEESIADAKGKIKDILSGNTLVESDSDE
jgi:polyisoprenyl-teichoic acid--peptidoglycan teichoic acid transferase